MAEINSPTLDQLDAWSSTLDALPAIALDDAYWTTLDLWETSGSAAIAVTASAATPNITASMSGTAAGAASFAAIAHFTVSMAGSAAISVSATATAEHIKHTTATASVAVSETAQALLTA